MLMFCTYLVLKKK